MSNTFNLLDIVRAAWKYKITIIIINVVALVAVIIITLPRFMPAEFESTAIIYSSNPALSDRPYLFKTESGGELSIDLFGGKEDVDRIVSVAKSSQLMVHVIEKFNLYEHYGIDTSHEFHVSKAISRFKKNFKSFRNEYRGIELHVIDQNREMAATIANELVIKIDEINKNMLLESRLKVLKVFEKRLVTKRIEVSNLTDSLTKMRKKYNIYDVATQSEVLSTQITKTESELRSLKAERATLLKDNTANPRRITQLNASINGLEKKLIGLTTTAGGAKFNLESFAEGSDKVTVLEAKLKHEINELETISSVHGQYLIISDQNIPSIYIMEHAHPADKENPKRLLLVAATMLITFFLSITFATLIETFR